MEGKVSSILINIREKSRNESANHMKQYSCRLKNIDTSALELLELTVEDAAVRRNGEQVRLAYSNLFNHTKTVKPAAFSRVILVRGEAAVGKTMLCMSIMEEWANGKLFQEFQIVLLLPLSSRNIASASSLSELLNVLYTDFNDDTCTKLASYLKNNNVLIIADGWEDLHASKCQTGSFLHSLLFSSDVIPTSFSTVLITSRPGCSQLHIILQSVDRFITLTGFDNKAIESIIQSEFEGDLKRIRYFTAQLNDNPLVASICSTPLNLAIVCNLCRSNHAQPLPNTMTELYAKLIWTLATASINSNDLRKSISLSSHHDLPEELQQSWWHVCELAFRNIEKGHDAFSQSDATVLTSESSELKKISYFGLIKSQPESGNTLSFSFLHPCIEEYLAALHLAKQPQEVQFGFMQELMTRGECESKTVITFWHFFISNYVRVVVNVNPDIIIQVLKVISPRLFSTKREYFINLCHYSFEAKHHVVNHQIVKAMHAVDNDVLRFGHPRNVHDCNAMIYVIGSMTQECKVEINFQDCHLKPEHINSLANALGEKSGIVQVRGLNLSSNKLNNSLAVDFFDKIAATLNSLKVLILRNCDIGTNLDIQAILSALAESSCQTLTHLDLSLNPISVSFLQILQRHIESFATMKELQILGLKGSLKDDVSTSFLANFSDTLSTKCKCLRQLDLSDNNLGEPRNPDLSKIISQLLSLQRGFNLRLNEEYMSEVHDEFICVMEESIKKKGTINHTIAHGAIVGPGRSGKNTLMSRLMGNGPPEPDSISPSTGVLENIVKVEVKKLCTVATAVSNLEWKKLKYDEEALELIMTTARYHSATTTVSKPVAVKYIEHKEKSLPDFAAAKSPLPNSKPATLVGTKQSTKYKILQLFKRLKRFKTSKSEQGPICNYVEEQKDAVVYAPEVEPVDIFKQAVKLQGMDALREHLESSWSLYLTNTGGQIEFQEYLPLLVCGPSIFFVTFPLHYDLEKPYDVRYEYQDGQVKTYKSPATLLEELLQTLATINASNFTSGQQRDSETAIKPKIFFVGTHRDHLPEDTAEEIIKRKDKLLQDYVRQTSLFKQDSIYFAEAPEQLLFTVNNLSKDDDEFQKIRSAVQKTVERNEFTIECPSSWLILSLILRAKHKSDQVMSFDKCLSIAQQCGITDRNELKQALSFIHSRLGLVRYFNIEDLNTLVVIDPQILFDKITDLIVKTFTSDNVKVKEIEDFCQRGIIPVAVMQEISDNSSSDSKLPFIWLTKLLNYLRIAALFTDSDGDKYFFPSALCHAPELHSNQPSPSDSWPPLLVGFKSGFCPRGIPGALIKYLMTNEMESSTKWNIIPNRVFKNQVSFAIQAHGVITLRILPTHLEICYESEADLTEAAYEEVDSNENELTKKTCEMAYVQIKKGMSTVTSQCNECDYFFGFYCTLTTCKAHKHPAQLEWARDGKSPFKLVCKVAGKRGILPKGYELWNLRKKPKPGKAQLDKEIDADNNGVLKHLGQIADSMIEWKGRISEELQLTPADVACICELHPNKLKLQSREALHMWKQRLSSEATYQKLINVFERAGYCTYADIVRNTVCDAESEMDDFSDYEEPIPQPETYPHLKICPPSPPKLSSRKRSTLDEYLLVNPTTARGLPEGDVYSQKVLDSRNVTVVPKLSSKHKLQPTAATPVPPPKPPTLTVNYPIYVGKYDYATQNDDDLAFKKGDLMYILTPVIITDDDIWWFAHLKDSGEEGYIPSNYVTKYKGLDAEEWFLGRLTQVEAEKQLMMPSNGYGSYLVRDRETDPGNYSLSIRDRERVRHYRIYRLENGTFFVTRRITFETIQDLVAYYQQQADGLCANLIQICILSAKQQLTLNISERANNEWEIDRRQIRIIKKRKDGEFSEVWDGLWNGTTPVTVMMHNPQTITVHGFLQSAALMMQLCHINIIQIYGVCTKDEPIYIITEPIKHNSLLDYLRFKGRSLKFPQLIDMASQVAEGMAYLEEQNYVHRNLAARNIIVLENYKNIPVFCKVANFEMARKVDEAQSQAKVAPKWAAPEAALYNRFTIKSDVWSFGIILYEIFTYGRFPYPDITNAEILEKVKQGYRMSQPLGCPDKLYNIMLNCWRERPENRSTFEALKWQLEEYFY